MTTQPATKNHIRHLHAFRGFAIVTIVGAHSWSLMLFTGDFDSMPAKNTVFAATETLFHGSTLYFALISGLLFSLALRSRGWKAFFRSKVLNVLTPYAIVNLLFLAAFWPMYASWLESQGKSANFLAEYFGGLLKGSIMLPYWYIPVLLGLYVFTPLVDALMRRRHLVWLAFVLAALPLVVSRTTYPDLLSPQTVVYFLGAYALGMLAGENYEKAKALIHQHLASLWVAAIACSLVILLFFLNEYQPPGSYSVVQTMVYVQKLSIAALVLHYFSQNEQSLPNALMVMGTYAFAIYFFHFFMVNVTLQGVLAASQGHANAWIATAGGAFILVAATSLSILLTWLLKRLFKSKSRIIIGA